MSSTEIGYNYTRCNECGMSWQGPDEFISLGSEDQIPCIKISVPFSWRGLISSAEGLKIIAQNKQIYPIKDFGHFYITFKDKSFHIQTLNCISNKVEKKTEEMRVYQTVPEAKPVGNVYTYSRSEECGMYCKGPKLAVDVDSEVDTPVKLSFPSPWTGIFSRKEGLKIEGSGKNIFTISQKNVDFSITFVEGQDPKVKVIPHACADQKCPQKKLRKQGVSNPEVG